MLLLKVDIDTRDFELEEDLPSEGVVSASDPTPEVEMELISAEINSSGELVIEVEGTVRDRLSEVLNSGRVQNLSFKVDGTSLGSDVSLNYQNDDTTPLRLADSTTTFTRTLTISDPMPRAYIIQAETDANAAGNTGWDKVAVGVAI